jgi:hypothetical protein
MKYTLIIFSLVVFLTLGCSSNKKNQKESDPSLKQNVNTQKQLPMNDIQLLPELNDYVNNIPSLVDGISEERKKILSELATYMAGKINNHEPVHLNFICTHNSRRSHLSQVWSSTFAYHFGLAENIRSYSGGTEATAFNPRAVSALERAGFAIENPGGANPRYRVVYSNAQEPLICFSKTYDDPYNPFEKFAAVMTCSDADANCPIVRGSEERISLPYRDPKESDETPEEKAIYDERCLQIATEMYYAYRELHAQLNEETNA